MPSAPAAEYRSARTTGKPMAEDEGQARGGVTLITLSLTPQEASLMAFIQEQGKIRILMRSPTDTKIEPLQPANWDTFFRHVMPYAVKEDRKPDTYIEVYRGLNKENIPVYKAK